MKKSKNKEKINELFSIIETVFISMFVITLVFTFLLRIATVKGDSMMNTLFEDDMILASAFCVDPEAEDIVIINAYDAYLLDENNNIVKKEGLDKQIVKRVIATEGQTVDIDFIKGTITVDGVVLEEDYITGLTHNDEKAFTGKYPVTVPDGYVFVLGDNRAVSKDSRSDEIGFVAEEDIVGKVFIRISPVSEIGIIS